MQKQQQPPFPPLVPLEAPPPQALDGPFENVLLNDQGDRMSGTRRMGLLDGRIEFYSRDGVHLRSVYYRLGKRHGQCLIYRASEEHRLSVDITYKKDMRWGEYKAYFENGMPRATGTYKRDALHGEYRTWRSDGTPDSVTVFVHGKSVKCDILLPEYAASSSSA